MSKSDHVKTARIINSAQRTFTRFAWFPFLHGSGAGIPGIAVLVYCVAMASTQEVEMLRRQLDELTAQMTEIRQHLSSTAMNAAVTGLTEAVRTMGQSVSKPRREDMRVGKPDRTHLAETLTTGTSHSTDTRVRSILPVLPC